MGGGEVNRPTIWLLFSLRELFTNVEVVSEMNFSDETGLVRNLAERPWGLDLSLSTRVDEVMVSSRTLGLIGTERNRVLVTADLRQMRMIIPDCSW